MRTPVLGRYRRLLAVAGIMVAAAACAGWLVPRPGFDVLIRNVVVHDGTGAPPFRGSVGIRGDRIAAIYRRGAFVWPRAKTTIEGGGLDLAPGFIDTHTHADQNILGSSGPIRANNFVGQGITTIITGNCGRSPVDVAVFRASIAVRRSNVNIATLIGLNSVRQQVMHDATTPATPAEIVRLCQVVDAGMRAGAAGVSTGSVYFPGRFAGDAETIEQLATASRYGGIFATHLRDEGNDILRAVREAVHQSRAARIPLLISHLKITGPANCAKYAQLTALIDGGGLRGIPVYTDQYPYAASSSSLDLYLPDWYVGSHGAARRQILDTEAGRARLFLYLKSRLHSEGFGSFGFARVASFENDARWVGLSIAEIASMQGPRAGIDEQLEVVVEMLRHGGAQMVYHNLCEALTLEIARRPTSMFGSDSAIRYSDGDYMPHPRGWGTFPRVFAHFVRRAGVLTVDEAIRRMTSLPALVFGLERRGIVREGYYADLVIFDANTIADRATYSRPFRPPRGVCYVLVNGRIVVHDSDSLEKRWRGIPDIDSKALPGRFLPRSTRLRSAPPIASQAKG